MKGKVLILGGGRQGAYIAKALSEDGIPVSVWDISEEAIESISSLSFVKAERKNIFHLPSLEEELSNFQVVVDALPGNAGFEALEKLAEAGKDVVSFSFMKKDYFLLDEKAKERGVTIIPDCGVGPGLTNLLVGNGLSRMPNADRVFIWLGGIPKHPLPPLYQNITWSIDDFLDEYKRPARVRRNGILKEIEPLSDIRKEEDFPVANLVSFPSDGLRSLLRTTDVMNIEERTLRYLLHIERMKVLNDLGFLDEEFLTFLNASYPVKYITARILEKKFSSFSEEDYIIGRIEIASRKVSRSYEIFAEYDYETSTTAMSRATAITASAFVKLLLSGEIVERGVLPPEKFGDRETILRSVLKKLKQHNVTVREKVRPAI